MRRHLAKRLTALISMSSTWKVAAGSTQSGTSRLVRPRTVMRMERTGLSETSATLGFDSHSPSSMMALLLASTPKATCRLPMLIATGSEVPPPALPSARSLCRVKSGST